MGGWVDLAAYVVQVQPDLEDLTVNMEDNEGVDGAPPKSLGKLQFSLDYDFQKGEVCNAN